MKTEISGMTTSPANAATNMTATVKTHSSLLPRHRSRPLSSAIDIFFGQRNTKVRRHPSERNARYSPDNRDSPFGGFRHPAASAALTASVCSLATNSAMAISDETPALAATAGRSAIFHSAASWQPPRDEHCRPRLLRRRCSGRNKRKALREHCAQRWMKPRSQMPAPTAGRSQERILRLLRQRLPMRLASPPHSELWLR